MLFHCFLIAINSLPLSVCSVLALFLLFTRSKHCSCEWAQANYFSITVTLPWYFHEVSSWSWGKLLFLPDFGFAWDHIYLHVCLFLTHLQPVFCMQVPLYILPGNIPRIKFVQFVSMAQSIFCFLITFSKVFSLPWLTVLCRADSGNGTRSTLCFSSIFLIDVTVFCTSETFTDATSNLFEYPLQIRLDIMSGYLLSVRMPWPSENLVGIPRSSNYVHDSKFMWSVEIWYTNVNSSLVWFRWTCSHPLRRPAPSL